MKNFSCSFNEVSGYEIINHFSGIQNIFEIKENLKIMVL